VVSTLQDDLAASEAAQRELSNELAATRRELRELQAAAKGIPWYADEVMLN
jgi:hypothetical protein